MVDASFTLLDSNHRKSRLSASFFRAICADAGYPCTETSIDEDIGGVDATIDLSEAPLRVQLKATSAIQPTDKGLRFHIKQEWVEKWNRSALPVYLIVLVLDSVDSWVEHQAQQTVLKGKAYWYNVSNLAAGTRSLLIPNTNRIHEDTLKQWAIKELEGGYGG